MRFKLRLITRVDASAISNFITLCSFVQETALEKTYRWAQGHCKNVENIELAEVLHKSLSYLQIRPILLKYANMNYNLMSTQII